MRRLQYAIPFLLLAGCAVRQPGPRAWRFTDRTLIPPGVASAEQPEGTFTVPIAARPNCLESDALTIRRRRSAITVTVHRDALLRQPAGWLAEWTDRAESQGCIPSGQGALLAARILEALPLPAGATRKLLSGNGTHDYVDLIAGNRLQVVSPLMRAGAARDASPLAPSQVSGQGNSLTVEIKTSDDLIGVETAEYDIQAKTAGRGCMIVPASVEVNLRGRVETREAPVTNYFQFAPEIGFYRLFYKADQSEVLALAATRAGLPTDPDTCDKPGGPKCFNIPRGVGVNPYMRVEVNGAAMTVGINATVRNVLQKAKAAPETVLTSLAISKPFGGRPVMIEFDRGKQDILNMVLTGDEQIRW